MVDGKIVALDENGLTSFNLLQHHGSQASAIRFYLVNLLFDRGESWLNVPRAHRCAALGHQGAPVRHPMTISETIEVPSPQII